MRGRVIWALPLGVVAAVGAGTVMAATNLSHSGSGTVAVAKTSTLGSVLVAANGHTLYRYTVDSKSVNRCSNVPACNTYWPALLVKPGTKPTVGAGVSARLVGTIGAAHGMRQVTYAGYPLYFFAGDKKAGQTNGQGFEKKWYVVGATGALIEHAVTTAATSGGTTTSGGYSYR
jgi:predicted lipoprotein with Yx(FWY)xxD motif